MNENGNAGGEFTEHTQAIDRTASQPEQKAQAEEAKVAPVVLPPQKYKLKIALLFSDAWKRRV